MSTQLNTPNGIRRGLAIAFIAGLASSDLHAASETTLTSLHSETYGKSSGDSPLPNVGLLLELVDGDLPNPMLRLFGGFPGNDAIILLSGEQRAATQDELVGPAAVVLAGKFDPNGYYTVSLDQGLAGDLAGGRIFAQGMHHGVAGIDAEYGMVDERSNGLVIFPVETEDQALTIDELKFHLPADRRDDVDSADDLTEKLRVALNSVGDSVTLKVGLEASIGLGVDVGGEAKGEFQVTRTAESQYLLTMAPEFAGKVGVELWDGVEANAGLAIGGQRIFRHYSIPGVVRGIRIVLLASYFPELQPKGFVNGKVADWGLRDKARATLDAARVVEDVAVLKLRSAEELAFDVAEMKLAKEQKELKSATDAFDDAKKDVQKAKIPTPGQFQDVAKTGAKFAAQKVQVAAAKAAVDVARAAVDAAQVVADAAREARCAALNTLVRLDHIAWVIAQGRGYVVRHHAGLVNHFKTFGEIEAVLAIPGVSLKNFGAGASVAKEQKFEVRFEPKSSRGPARITVTRSYETKIEIQGGDGEIGGRTESKKALTFVDSVEFGDGSPRWSESSATLSSDLLVVGGEGFILAEMNGFGRAWSIQIAQEELFAKIGDAFDLLKDDGLVAALVGTELVTVGYSIQDRRLRNLELEAKASYVGNGGGIEGSLEWADQGRLLAQNMLLRDAAERMIDRVLP